MQIKIHVHCQDCFHSCSFGMVSEAILRMGLAQVKTGIQKLIYFFQESLLHSLFCCLNSLFACIWLYIKQVLLAWIVFNAMIISLIARFITCHVYQYKSLAQIVCSFKKIVWEERNINNKITQN